MLFTEWKLEEAQQVWFEEGREEERLKNADRLLEIARLEEDRLLEIARAMFTDGDSLEKIARNTGIPLEMLKEKLLVQ